MSAFKPVLTRSRVDKARFDAEIVPMGVPVLLKGQVADWAAVKAGKESDQALGAYLKSHDAGGMVQLGHQSREHNGRYFYSPDLKGMNFRIVGDRLPNVIDWLITHKNRNDGDRIYLQALPLEEILPAFATENPFDLTGAQGRIWIGNEVRVQTHFDPACNLACLVAGQRRFTLFPPPQSKNLYPGPLDLTPGGVPVSMAEIETPDFARFPRLAEALEHGLIADMEPGDALYIPYMWWHHVQSHGGFNVLVNYWWNPAPPELMPPFFALIAGLATLRHLPEDQKAVWRDMFDLFVFDVHGDPAAHLPPPARGPLGSLSPALLADLKQKLLNFLK